MLYVTIPDIELWDEFKEEFINVKGQTLELEHSLISLSKWESKWCKPFLSKDEKTEEETLDYIKCMTITKNVDPNLYKYMPVSIRNEINEYINAKMTATWFNEKDKARPNSKQTTSELIYYWMIANNIPIKCEKWHLNRLLTLIKVCSIEGQPSKKMSSRDVIQSNAALNAARRKKLNAKG